jgi:hypothetical protein
MRIPPSLDAQDNTLLLIAVNLGSKREMKDSSIDIQIRRHGRSYTASCTTSNADASS